MISLMKLKNEEFNQQDTKLAEITFNSLPVQIQFVDLFTIFIICCFLNIRTV